MWYDALDPFFDLKMTSNLSQSTTEEAAKDVAAFVAIFFENFKSLRGRGFHLSGESYGVSFFFILCTQISLTLTL